MEGGKEVFLLRARPNLHFTVRTVAILFFSYFKFSYSRCLRPLLPTNLTPHITAMSEPIPESVPTSQDPRSRRPLKRARPSSNVPDSHTAASAQASIIESLMADPEREIRIPDPSSAHKHTLAPPPEIVANVQGSSAGAGSGEFHVYKASRRREYERLRTMEEDAKQEEEAEKWRREAAERKRADEEQTRKKREKRNKKKGKQGKAKGEGTPQPQQGGFVDGRSKTNGVQEHESKTGANVPSRSDRVDKEHGDTVMAVAQVVEEAGVVIHDDD